MIQAFPWHFHGISLVHIDSHRLFRWIYQPANHGSALHKRRFQDLPAKPGHVGRVRIQSTPWSGRMPRRSIEVWQDLVTKIQKMHQYTEVILKYSEVIIKVPWSPNRSAGCAWDASIVQFSLWSVYSCILPVPSSSFALVALVPAESYTLDQKDVSSLELECLKQFWSSSTYPELVDECHAYTYLLAHCTLQVAYRYMYIWVCTDSRRNLWWCKSPRCCQMFAGVGRLSVATTSQPSHVASCCFLERLRVFFNALFLERLGSPIESCMERLGRRCLPLGTPSLQHVDNVDQFWTGSRCPPSWFLPSYSSKDPMSWQRISMRLRNEDQLHIDLQYLIVIVILSDDN